MTVNGHVNRQIDTFGIVSELFFECLTKINFKDTSSGFVARLGIMHFVYLAQF